MDDIKLGLKNDKLIIGTKQTVKALRKVTVSKIFLAANCPEIIEDDINHYAQLVEVPVEKLTINCDELGTQCKKPFLISVVGIAK